MLVLTRTVLSSTADSLVVLTSDNDDDSPLRSRYNRKITREEQAVCGRARMRARVFRIFGRASTSVSGFGPLW